MRRILFALAFAASATLAAKADTIDFTTYTYGQQLASADGVTFSLAGPGTLGTPTIGTFGGTALGNSTSSGYPTAEQLVFTFSATASGITFGFNNYGDSSFGRGATTFTAYDGATVVDSGFIGFDNGVEETVLGSGITSLVLDNGGNDWLFGVSNLNFTPGVATTPEPSSLVLLGTGILGLAGAARRRFGK